MTDEPINPIDEEKQALQRIAATHDGVLFHRYLRRVLEGVFDLADDSALRAQNGRRSLARDLMRLMAEGIDDRHDRNDDSPILARAGKPVAVSGRARRDPRTYPRVDSFADTLNPDGSEAS